MIGAGGRGLQLFRNSLKLAPQESFDFRGFAMRSSTKPFSAADTRFHKSFSIQMLESLGLISAQIDLLNAIALQLSKVPGVIAVVLGGSYARRTARPDSDLDIGIYYSKNSPPDI